MLIGCTVPVVGAVEREVGDGGVEIGPAAAGRQQQRAADGDDVDDPRAEAALDRAAARRAPGVDRHQARLMVLATPVVMVRIVALPVPLDCVLT